MNTPISTLSQATGLSKEKIKQIWDEVQENKIKLDSCPLHDFSIKEEKRWKCSKCDGWISAHSKLWYEKGLEHGSNNRGS